jgi:hypothetical protein
MRLKKTTMLVSSMLLVVSANAVLAKTPVAIADPDPAPDCGLLCIDPIDPVDPVDVPVSVYTIGTGKQILDPNNSSAWKPIAASVWVDGTHTPWGLEPEQGNALFLKGQDVYTLSSPTYQLPVGSPLIGLSHALQGGPILRRNGEIVRQYPSLEGNPIHGMWDGDSHSASASCMTQKLWVGGNDDVYALVRMSSHDSSLPYIHTRIYRNDALFKDFMPDGFMPCDLHGSNLAWGQTAIVAGGTRNGKATIWKNNSYITLSQLGFFWDPSRVTSVVRTGNGWIHAIGKTGGDYDQRPVYWKISPTNVVTEQRLSIDFPLPPGAFEHFGATVNDVHIAANGKVYVVGSFCSLFPYDPAVITGIPNPFSCSAAVWIDGQPQVLPAGDLYLDRDSAQAVTTDVNGNYYVAGTWAENFHFAPQSLVGVVWKNGELYQIADASADASMFTDIVVPRL